MKKYLITSKEFYTRTPEIFQKRFQKQLLKHKPEYALYRDKDNPNYAELAECFVEVCKEFDYMKGFIHQDVDLAAKLGASGVHLTSNQFDEIKYAKSKNLEVIISTHTHDEVLKAQKEGADAVTYSPIFQSPNKGEPKGLDDLKELLNKCTIKVFALGGIVKEEQIKSIENCNTYGFASIRYFK